VSAAPWATPVGERSEGFPGAGFAGVCGGGWAARRERAASPGRARVRTPRSAGLARRRRWDSRRGRAWPARGLTVATSMKRHRTVLRRPNGGKRCGSAPEPSAGPGPTPGQRDVRTSDGLGRTAPDEASRWLGRGCVSRRAPADHLAHHHRCNARLTTRQYPKTEIQDYPPYNQE
jgi:hypothetical protein